MDLEKSRLNFLGCMSGTSLDGLDLCLCSFFEEGGAVEYKVYGVKTIGYPKELERKLKDAHELGVAEFLRFSNEYGRFIGNECKIFMRNFEMPYTIASHGHTVFHQPFNQFTFQIGAGASIAVASGADTLCDFRSIDVALDGQGAPLVPIGDKLLFGEYDYCLNIGGFANCTNNATGTAFDICASNFVLNALTRLLKKPYDKGGEIAKSANVDQDLLGLLNNLPYYGEVAPKSLGREWVENELWKLIDRANLSIEDKIATYTEHIAIQIAKLLGNPSRVIVTGGGALNDYLISRLTHYSSSEIIVPDETIVNFKEALIFAFLGYLYVMDKENCLSMSTGAFCSSVGGCLYKAPSAVKPLYFQE